MYQGIINGGAVRFQAPKELDNSIPKPNGYRLLIRMLDVEQATTTKSGLQLHIPDSDKEELEEQMTIGYVQSVGDLCYKNDMFENKPWCVEGDYVLFARMQGIDFEFNKIRYKLLQDDRPLMTFKEKELIDLEILSKE
jgi:co-chaperonin GroES (HSP10)